MLLSNLKGIFNGKDQGPVFDGHYSSAMDQNLGIYGEEQFQEMLAMETKRSKRSSRPFLLMHVTVSEDTEEAERLYLFKRIALILNSITRDIDIKGWHSYEKCIGVIFTEIRPVSGHAIESRIHEKIHEGLLKGLHLDQVSKINLSFQSSTNGQSAAIFSDCPVSSCTPHEHSLQYGQVETGPSDTQEGSSLVLENTAEGKIEHGFNRQMSLLLLGDLALLGFAAFMGALFRLGLFPSNAILPLASLAVAAVLYPCMLFIFDMYNVSRSFRSYDSILRTIAAAGFATLLCGMVFYLFPETHTGRGVLLLQALTLMVLLVLWRVAFDILWRKTNSKKGAIVVGAGQRGKAICKLLNSPISPYKVRGLLDDDPQKQGTTVGPHMVLGTTGQINEVMKEVWAKAAILAIPRNCNRNLVRKVLEARMRGIRVLEMSQVYENLTGRVPVQHIQDDWFLYTDGFYILSKEYVQKFKRLFDIFSSSLLLFLASPVILLTAIAIRLDSSGPVFYRQDRVGKLGKVFSIVKFRSMFENAEAKGIKWATKRDPRVTRVGRWIRLFRIDEIPQLWNVLKGEMSLVGPRPERPEFVKELEAVIPYYAVRHCVPPGVTGWAQVSYPYGASVEDALHKLEYDLYYIKNMSILLDLKIAMKTVGVVLIGDGAR